jgi:putative transposase
MNKGGLSAKRYVYFWADGIHAQARLEDDAECLLVIIGTTPKGKKELVCLIDGVRENAQSRRDLLLDQKRRGAGRSWRAGARAIRLRWMRE